MNKYFLSIIVIGCVVGFSSCNDDDENNTVTGKWQGTEMASQAFITGIPIPIVDETDEGFNTQLQFNEDATILVDDDDDDFHEEGTWEYTDGRKKIKVTGAFPENEIFDPTETFEVKELTATKLVLYLEKNVDYEYEGDPVNATAKMTLKFDRIST
jgi:hypothetical protein